MVKISMQHSARFCYLTESRSLLSTWNKRFKIRESRPGTLSQEKQRALFSVSPSIIGDARKPESYQKALQGKKADILFTDPPYCILSRKRQRSEHSRQRKLDHDAVVSHSTRNHLHGHIPGELRCPQ
jgi:site-specific DNA-adenine methylase